ncbi:Nodulin-26 [Apostasia shenzhenica]|uniref:Nodulin-26 n=1 Tax=Apostasia shenzhenica TaxID=1088818 RepID=A0A2I0AYA3_9ASPA|nr:Nodulin-26 [Apostasia shenzhenica]
MFIGMGSLFVKERGGITDTGVATAWGAVITVNIYTFGHISGAHINPAVTFALALVGQFPWKHVLIYVIAEVVGAILASLTLLFLFDGENMRIMLTLPPGPNPAADLKVVVWELIISFMYAMANYGAKVDPRSTKELSGVAVGTAIFFCILVAGEITGASMNPARSLGPAIMTGNYSKIWIYVLSPVVGSVAAAAIFFVLLMPKNKEITDQDKQPETALISEDASRHSVNLNLNHFFSQEFKSSSVSTRELRV